MKVDYICEKCSRTFDDANSCARHEEMHRREDEFCKSVPSKFEPHSVVRRKSDGRVGSVDAVKVMVDGDTLRYGYFIGFDDMFHAIEAPEDDLELVMTKAQVVEAYGLMLPRIREFGLSPEEFFEATAAWYMD